MYVVPFVEFAAVTIVAMLVVAWSFWRLMVIQGRIIDTTYVWQAVKVVLAVYVVYAAHQFGVSVNGVVDGIETIVNVIV